jgi:hypothetical protein
MMNTKKQTLAPRATLTREEESRYFEALEAARTLPVAKVLDELALHDLVALEV